MTSTTDSNSTLSSKKKRSPNWLPSKEEQLAISWINCPCTISRSNKRAWRLPESSKPGTPTSMTTASSRPMGSKAAKQQHLNFTDFKEDRASQAKEFNTLTKQKLIIIQEGIQVSKEKNEVELKQLKIEEKKLIIEKEHRASEVVMNELVLLSKCEDDLKDPDALEVLKKMKDKVKRKWLDS
ncbi:hypothetical protein PPACK8108_LOCUS6442 [Phakopsora pachyrhizi]|uniref:No apical meristem-associated C-terminal domain-containing protein n=1 Tax=Phakopsora pachyrhizi TaxID=170000 RepID=A0AAV0ASW8_PHAPC|nr:hypothetical protein PPACK8108_LOCUS6442 [Phakopsora pachyrhizi]